MAASTPPRRRHRRRFLLIGCLAGCSPAPRDTPDSVTPLDSAPATVDTSLCTDDTFRPYVPPEEPEYTQPEHRVYDSAGSDCPTGMLGQCAAVEFDANTSGVWQVGVENRGCANPTLRYALWVTVDGEEAPLTLAQVDEPAFIWTTVTTVYRMDLMATQK